MSDAPMDQKFRLDIDELVSRIERQQAETQKFVAEQHKLMAEGRKYNRDRWIVPFTIIGAIIAAIAARLPEILRAFGIGP
jgi:hypothetical protein